MTVERGGEAGEGSRPWSPRGEFGSGGNWSQRPSELDNVELNWEGGERLTEIGQWEKKMLFAVLIAFPA